MISLRQPAAPIKGQRKQSLNGRSAVPPQDSFFWRHVGSRQRDIDAISRELGYDSLDALVDAVIPPQLRIKRSLPGWAAESETDALAKLKAIASQNQVFRSYIGLGYHDTVTPPVIQRNILENPGWYTQYTPYQAEIAQGRLEALLNFQTMVIDLTGLEVANASMLDEGTAAAEAMYLSFQARAEQEARAYFVSSNCHPQTIEIVKTRAKPLGIRVIVGRHDAFDFDRSCFGALVQYPDTDGVVADFSGFCEKAHAAGILVTAACDLLSLVVLKAPGEFGADIAVGSTQRFGVPLGFGGPHAAFFATKDAYKRLMPGRIVGVSKDSSGKQALRLALQTREQHIRRERATSNICTAQVLLAVIASMYAVYHGPEGLKRIASRIHHLAAILAAGLRKLGYKTGEEPYFDTIVVDCPRGAKELAAKAAARKINLRAAGPKRIVIALDETVGENEVMDLWKLFAGSKTFDFTVEKLAASVDAGVDGRFARSSSFLAHPVFNTHRSETEMLRYLRMLEAKDLSLTTSMIPLGSCTMKLNATSEMLPVTWPEFGRIHPYVPAAQTKGYRLMFAQLEERLAELTGFDSVSLMPNAGSQGEYAGLLVIRAYHESRGQGARKVCLIPQSAHGTNPASAALAGFSVVVVACDADGNIDVDDLRKKAEEHKDDLACLMATYPSTHGVFEETIQEISRIVHDNGGQVYMDGANLNALVGLVRPGDLGADVAHMNLHKTFCIPHGGGGPGMGPIGVAKHLAPFLPSHPYAKTGGAKAIGPVSSAPWGSASILTISWVYIAMMGSDGLREATKIAILNANYAAKRLSPHFPVLYKGKNGLVAHECILDLRGLKDSSDVVVEDVAKRLMDYGFHAPTVSWPVAGTVMVEPTESESKAEIDRFCEAMASIRSEIEAIVQGKADRSDNPLKNAPHTAERIAASDWSHPYSREQAAFPAPWCRERKFWPSVGRVDSAFGDRNFICSCPPIESYAG